ncbi:metallophosphoesterase [Halobacillus sp. B23F22_1]|uniref:metallophosphoesterase n=1 Tax=Halobacillus sp. B23F22_1 TaxID=3459514 RepID=UPI00373F908E
MGKKSRIVMTAALCIVVFIFNFLMVNVASAPSLPDTAHKPANGSYQMVNQPLEKQTDDDYTFVWMSDTQYYSKRNPHIYKAMVNWIAEKKNELSIPYVIHTGDIVHNWDDETQWKHAADSMNVLENEDIPYGMLAGNHDIDLKNKDYSTFSKYFGQSQFENHSYYGGSYKNNRGHYDILNVNGNNFIMIYMSWGIDQEEIDWVNKVLQKYPEHTAFLNLHQYLLPNGKRSRLGEKLFEQVITPNENVAVTLSGHYYGTASRVDTIDDNGDGMPDRSVHQLFANYQGGPDGGQGYMRLLHVSPEENKIYVKTYSPYMDNYNYYDTEDYPGKDEFVIELPLNESNDPT